MRWTDDERKTKRNWCALTVLYASSRYRETRIESGREVAAMRLRDSRDGSAELEKKWKKKTLRIGRGLKHNNTLLHSLLDSFDKLFKIRYEPYWIFFFFYKIHRARVRVTLANWKRSVTDTSFVPSTKRLIGLERVQRRRKKLVLTTCRSIFDNTVG